MIKKSLLMMMAFAFITIAAFAQRVGDTGQFMGDNYRVTAVNGNTLTLEKVVAQADNPVNWVAVADSTFGTSQINGVAFGNNT